MKNITIFIVCLSVAVVLATFFFCRSNDDIVIKEEHLKKDSVTQELPAPKKEPPGVTADLPDEVEDSNLRVPTEKTVKDKTVKTPTVHTTPKKTVALVNGDPVSISDVLPPGVLQAGDSLPEAAYNTYLQKAIDQRLLLQEVRELGLMDTPEYQEMVEDMKDDLSELPGLTDEQKQWRLEDYSRMAVIQELYQREGLSPERIKDEEVDTCYEAHNDEYEWLRKRENLKGSSPEKVERMVKMEIKRDLEAPRKKEVMEKRNAYLESLRERADIEIME